MGRVDSERFEQIFEKIEICILLNHAASDWNKTNFPSKLFDYLSRNRFVLSTANSVLEPYYGLGQLYPAEGFPR